MARASYMTRVSTMGVEPGVTTNNYPYPALDEIECCRRWLREFAKPTKTIRPTSSYYYKHQVENWAARAGESRYISNGAFIVAATIEGIRWERASDRSPNACFAMSVRKATRP